MRKVTAAAARLAERAVEAVSLRLFWRRSPKEPGLGGRLEPDEYDQLLNIVGFFLSAHRERASLSGGQLVVQAEDGLWRFDLAPLVEACRAMPRGEWVDAVEAFLSARLGGAVPEPAPAGPPLAPVVEAAPGRPGAWRGRRLGAWLEAAATLLKARLPGMVVLLKALLGRAVVVLKVFLARAVVFLKVLLARVVVVLKVFLARAAVLLKVLLCRVAVIVKALLVRVVPLLKALLARAAVLLKALAARAAVLLWARLRGPVPKPEPELAPAVVMPPPPPAPPVAKSGRAQPGAAAVALRSTRPGEWRDALAALLKARPVGRVVLEPEPEPAPASEEWSAFEALVVECFRRHGLGEAKVGRDVVLARDAAGHKLRVQAPGLERVPRELGREWWGRWVDEVLGERLGALGGREALSGRSLADARELLGLQLYDEAWLSEEVLAEAVFSRDLPGLMSALVCRLPEGTFRLSGETVTAWGVDVQEVAEAALANLRRLRPPMQRVIIAPGAVGMRFEGDGDFAAAQAVLLGENRDCAHAYGALVAVPRRSLLLVCPLEPRKGAAEVYMAAAVSLIRRLLESEAAGHMALSRRLYWYRRGAFVGLPYEGRVEGGRPVVEFAPAGEFAAALAEMG